MLITWTRFVDSRQRDLPGVGGANPAWVAPSAELRYAGTVRYTNPFDPSGFEVFYPVVTTIGIEEVGADWASYRSRTATDLDGYEQRSEAVGAAGATGPYWYDTAALAVMSAGDVLDVDPTTGARLTVDAVDPGHEVTLRTEARGVSVLGSYDVATGVLRHMVIEQSVTFATVDLELTSMG